MIGLSHMQDTRSHVPPRHPEKLLGRPLEGPGTAGAVTGDVPAAWLSAHTNI